MVNPLGSAGRSLAAGNRKPIRRTNSNNGVVAHAAGVTADSFSQRACPASTLRLEREMQVLGTSLGRAWGDVMTGATCLLFGDIAASLLCVRGAGTQSLVTPERDAQGTHALRHECGRWDADPIAVDSSGARPVRALRAPMIGRKSPFREGTRRGVSKRSMASRRKLPRTHRSLLASRAIVNSSTPLLSRRAIVWTRRVS